VVTPTASGETHNELADALHWPIVFASPASFDSFLFTSLVLPM